MFIFFNNCCNSLLLLTKNSTSLSRNNQNMRGSGHPPVICLWKSFNMGAHNQLFLSSDLPIHFENEVKLYVSSISPLARLRRNFLLKLCIISWMSVSFSLQMWAQTHISTCCQDELSTYLVEGGHVHETPVYSLDNAQLVRGAETVTAHIERSENGTTARFQKYIVRNLL